MGYCDVWDIWEGLSDRSSLNNQHFCDHRGLDFLIYGRLGKGDRSNIKNQKIRDPM